MSGPTPSSPFWTCNTWSAPALVVSSPDLGPRSRPSALDAVHRAPPIVCSVSVCERSLTRPVAAPRQLLLQPSRQRGSRADRPHDHLPRGSRPPRSPGGSGQGKVPPFAGADREWRCPRRPAEGRGVTHSSMMSRSFREQRPWTPMRGPRRVARPEGAEYVARGRHQVPSAHLPSV